jgi:hypothetical protein
MPLRRISSRWAGERFEKPGLGGGVGVRARSGECARTVLAAGVRCGSAAKHVEGHQQHHYVLRPDRSGGCTAASRPGAAARAAPALRCAAAAVLRSPGGHVPGMRCMPCSPPGAGKTYTMTGGRQSYSQRGLVPRMLSQLFQDLRARQDRVTSVQVGPAQQLQQQGGLWVGRGEPGPAVGAKLELELELPSISGIPPACAAQPLARPRRPPTWRYTTSSCSICWSLPRSRRRSPSTRTAGAGCGCRASRRCRWPPRRRRCSCSSR